MSCIVAVMVDGALRCSLSLSPNVLPDSPIYSSGQFMCGHLNLQITPLSLLFDILVLGCQEEHFYSVGAFEMNFVFPCCCMSL